MELHVSAREVSPGKTSAQGACIATVDGEDAFSIHSRAAKKSSDLEAFIEESNFRGDLKEAQWTTSGNYQLATSADHSIAFITCMNSRAEYTGLGFTLSVYRGGDQDRDLSSIITEYADVRMAEIDEEVCDTA
ncbi:hypothetical protein H7827_17145 [Streptomyces sp. JH002]|uniref:hypothetical protein n=1 Tax=Streptomyces sp. JH002 TaxID=2763259 RepID=UPI003D801474